MKTSLIVIIVLFTTSAKAQKFYAVGEVGYSTFSMGDMKDLQQAFIVQSGVTMKAVDKFPPYFGWGGVLAFSLKRVSFGIQGGYTSTGGRADYEDYSGIARFDQTISCYWIGPYFQAQLNKSVLWPIYFGFRNSFVNSALDMKTLLQLGTSSQSDQVSAHSTNLAFRPEFGVRRNIKRVFIQASVGYEFQIPGKLYLNDNSNSYLKKSNGDNIYAQWDGVRFLLGVGILLTKKSTE